MSCSDEGCSVNTVGWKKCTANNVETCTLTSGCYKWTITQVCSNTQTCQQGDQSASCVTTNCQDDSLCTQHNNGQKVCVGNSNATCNLGSDGCLHVSSQPTACASGTTCDGGVCKAPCPPNTLSSTGNPYFCTTPEPALSTIFNSYYCSSDYNCYSCKVHAHQPQTQSSIDCVCDQGYTNVSRNGVESCQLLNTYYKDADNDGYGNLTNTLEAVTKPTGYVTNSEDCNDNNAYFA